jgi:4-hydroxy-tetrahydrodipicolinate reductase
MNIALIGHGTMGKEVERVASAKGITVGKVFTETDNAGGRALTKESLKGIDVCIEFTLPASAVKNIDAVSRAGKPIVVGTTGWYDNLAGVKKMIGERGTGLVYAPNFSLGINLMMHLLTCAAHLFDRYDMYDISLRETHHRAKEDSPSGTALHISQLLLQNIRRKTGIVSGNTRGRIGPEQLHISSLRTGSVVGEHAIIFDSESDSMEFVHRAKDRSGFAHGALIAAAWIREQKGVFTMKDVLTTD